MMIISQLELLVALSVAKNVKIIIILVIILLLIIIIDKLELFVALSVAKDVKINFMKVGIWIPTLIQPPPVGDYDGDDDDDANHIEKELKTEGYDDW